MPLDRQALITDAPRGHSPAARIERLTRERDAMLADIQCVHTATRITSENCPSCRVMPIGEYCGTHGRILSILGRWLEVKTS